MRPDSFKGSIMVDENGIKDAVKTVGGELQDVVAGLADDSNRGPWQREPNSRTGPDVFGSVMETASE
jgi:hypothetical protein